MSETNVIEPKKELTVVQRTKAIFENEEVKTKLREMLGNRSAGFVTSVLSVIQSNDMLKNAEPQSVYMCAMMGASLDLPINANLGLAYIIPYNRKQPDGSYRQYAQFQIGYKGFIQLALRSGQFKTISATPIYKGQIVSSNALTGYEFDFENKESDELIGYASYFKLLNGFEKTLYMTKEELERHGGKYSKTFKQKYGLWSTDFEAMARKTVIKLLIQRYAPLSVEMQKATISDQSIVNDFETLDVDYVDNPRHLEEVDPMLERVTAMIDSAKKVDDLDKLEIEIGGIPEECQDKFELKYTELTKK